MDTGREITIVTVCDNHYAILLAALLKSIEINHKSAENINFYIISDNVSDENKTNIINSVKGSFFSLKWLSMKEAIPSHIQLPLDNSSFPLNVYVRLFIPYFIPQELTKVLYLDVDMIVNEDISKLWSIDIEDKIIAGVVDRSQVVSSTWGGIGNYKELGLNENTKYFNSGLLIIKPVEWREKEIAAKVIECVLKNKKFAAFPDQYGLNVIFANQWYELDPKWNCYSFSEEKNPFIIHFIGTKPIYKSYNFNEEYKKIFFTYLALTPWKNFTPAGESKRLGKKLYNLGKKKILEFFKK